MNGLYKEDGERYFAASNTKDGFVSYFDEIFGKADCDRVYILKGGPGVGKSTFMKKLGELAEKKGYTTQYFHCSSDPQSLDGIIIKEKRAAVIDGTSPHSAEPKLAGAREIIIDLGRAWDTDKLFEQKAEIEKLSKQKSRHYSDCYKFLYSKSVMDGLILNLVLPHLLLDKLKKSANRLSDSLFKSKTKNASPVSEIRITSAMSALGKIRLDTFEKEADACIFIKEPFAESRLPSCFMKIVVDRANQAGMKTYISYDAQNKDEIDALYFPEIKVSISIYDETLVAHCDKIQKRCRIINSARFVNMKELSKLKPLRKFYTKLSSNMEKLALESLEKAGKTHMETEKIYRPCTCYKTVEKIADEYYKKIL